MEKLTRQLIIVALQVICLVIVFIYGQTKLNGHRSTSFKMASVANVLTFVAIIIQIFPGWLASRDYRWAKEEKDRSFYNSPTNEQTPLMA